MKFLAPLAAAGLLAACSSPGPTANNSTQVAADGTEEVMPAEGDVIGENAVDTAPANAANAADAAGPVTARTEADYLGRWVGVEGMFLNVAKKPGGGVTLDMQWDLDNKGKFDGSVTAEGLRFMRDGVAETAVPTDGAATGLKWLDGKKDCLTVKEGEGYCRD
jgi:hypothetical protein